MKQYKLLEGFHSMLPQEAIVPSQPSDVQEGDYVKIGVETNDGKATEKFWAVVYCIDRDNWKYGVRINQDLCQTQLHGLSDGDELIVEFKHIVAVIK
ncbi:hypothetical protein B2_gp64 [Shigella phage B2]|nr:hypothetical protein B2_gp64 [Shigella phage B2]